jgi:SAM-dependent methyltransferase
MTTPTTPPSTTTPTTCNTCGAPLAAPALPEVRDPQSLETFAIRRCSACGLGHTSPVPADIGTYYGPAYYGKRHSFTDRYCLLRRMRLLRHATDADAGPPPKRLLDVGCGDGDFLRAATAAGWKAAGTDIGGALQNARDAGLDVHPTLDEVASAGPFDVATLWHTLEHFSDPRGTLERTRELLRPHGRLLVAVPDAAGLQAALFGKSWFHLDVPRHLFHFDRTALTTLLERTGFTVDRWHHQEIEQDVFGWMQSTLNAVLPAPNVLFQSLTGKPSHGGRAQRIVSYALGTALAPAAVAATAIGTLTRRGATMLAVARRSS